ncbi:hypothetical protein VE03_10476 [Pseudogymnoascus sp. 23342-1-I1]|nr:hypothetical protein VE03_10476 [Pseudogymnoascus sp. 23342-1-I1]
MTGSKLDAISSSKGDIVTILPIEIGIIVSDYLSFTEYLHARKVSKAWQRYWGNKHVLTRLFKHRFRIYFETKGPVLEPSFEEFAYQQHAMQLGRYCSMGIYSYDGQEHNYFGTLSLDRTYHNGRVAWSDDISIYVTTLLTGITTKYLISETESVSSFWLNQDLLVCQSWQRRDKLYAWSLDTGIQDTFEFTRKIKHITLSDNRVGIVTEIDVIIWTVGGVAQKITNGITTPTYTPEALLFHPTSPNKIVLLSTHKVTSTAQKHIFTLGLHAREYKYGSRQDTLSQGTCSQDTCSFDMPFTSDPYDEQVQFDIRLVNNNGLYSICWFYEEIVDLSDIDHTCTFKHNDNDGRSYYRLLSYDIYNKRFSLQCFASSPLRVDDVRLHTPPGEFYRDSHVWEDQMLTPVIGVGSTSYHYLFQTVRALDQVSNESSSVRFINGITDSLHSRPDEIRDLEGEKDGLISYFT